MKKLFHHSPLIVYFILSQFLLSCVSSNQISSRQIELIDPVYPKDPKRLHELFIYKGKDGFIEQYSLYLKNAVCLDNKCKLVEVTMYWDDAGNYSHLSYPEKKPLTKVEHEPFTEEDYIRLDTILKDKASILQNHSLAYLAKEPEKPKKKKAKKAPTDDSLTAFDDPFAAFGGSSELEEDFDGEAIATPAAVKDAVVKDAAWTTWVLWNYANTEIVPILHKETLAQASPEYIQKTLMSGEWSKIKFIISFLSRKNHYSLAYSQLISTVLAKANIDQIEPALEYIKKSSKSQSDYLQSLIKSLPAQSNYNAAIIIDEISNEEALDDETLLLLSSKLNQSSYYTVHLSLQLIENQNLFSDKLELNLSALLDVKDFFIARRAYRFLEEQKLSNKTSQKLVAFAKKHEDRI